MDAQHNFDVCYSRGAGIAAVDHREALEWYKRAAEAGYVRAHAILGERYSNGDGIAVYKVEAIKWVKRAAEGGGARMRNSCWPPAFFRARALLLTKQRL